jgi:hypothetical protein
MKLPDKIFKHINCFQHWQVICGSSFLMYAICACLPIVVFNTYCVTFLFLLCTLCCQFILIVQFSFPLWYSLTFIWYSFFENNINILAHLFPLCLYIHFSIINNWCHYYQWYNIKVTLGNEVDSTVSNM